MDESTTDPRAPGDSEQPSGWNRDGTFTVRGDRDTLLRELPEWGITKHTPVPWGVTVAPGEAHRMPNVLAAWEASLAEGGGPRRNARPLPFVPVGIGGDERPELNDMVFRMNPEQAAYARDLIEKHPEDARTLLPYRPTREELKMRPEDLLVPFSERQTQADDGAGAMQAEGRQRMEKAYGPGSLRDGVYRPAEDAPDNMKVFQFAEHTAIGDKAMNNVRQVLGRKAFSDQDIAGFNAGVLWPDLAVAEQGRARNPGVLSSIARGLAMEHPDTWGLPFSWLLKDDPDLAALKDSHYGAGQTMHAMSPQGDMTNAEVRNRIVGVLADWWDKARANPDDAGQYLGRIAHTLADSHSDSHILRNALGQIEQFQNYADQDPHQHGKADKGFADQTRTYPTIEDRPRIGEAIRDTTKMLFLFQHPFTSTADFRKWLEAEAMPLNPDVADRRSGGSAPEYAKPGAQTYSPTSRQSE